MTVMREIMKMAMMESMVIMVIEQEFFDNHHADVDVGEANYES